MRHRHTHTEKELKTWTQPITPKRVWKPTCTPGNARFSVAWGTYMECTCSPCPKMCIQIPNPSAQVPVSGLLRLGLKQWEVGPLQSVPSQGTGGQFYDLCRGQRCTAPSVRASRSLLTSSAALSQPGALGRGADACPLHESWEPDALSRNRPVKGPTHLVIHQLGSSPWTLVTSWLWEENSSPEGGWPHGAGQRNGPQ